MDNALIRKAAAQMTAEEFERIGKLAKKGLVGELLEKDVDNRAVLGQVSDSTLLLLRSSKSSADDIITVLLRHGDEAGSLYGQYGDDVIEIALRYGDEGLGGIKRHGTDFLIEYFAYGDEFVQSYLKYGDEAVQTYIRYGDDAAKVLTSGLTPEKIKEILSIPKGSRPDPSTYLSKEYIDAHLALFDDGASIIMTKKQYIAYVKDSSTIGIPTDGTQFVLPKSYCDDIASKAIGDITYYEKALDSRWKNRWRSSGSDYRFNFEYI